MVITNRTWPLLEQSNIQPFIALYWLGLYKGYIPRLRVFYKEYVIYQNCLTTCGGAASGSKEISNSVSPSIFHSEASYLLFLVVEFWLCKASSCVLAVSRACVIVPDKEFLCSPNSGCNLAPE